MESIQLISNLPDNKVKCPQCGSFKYKKSGKINNKQRYKCKNCGRAFTEVNLDFTCHVHSKHILPKDITPQEMKHLDIWDLRILGKPPTSRGNYSASFHTIKQNWLKEAIKSYVWLKAVSDSTSTLLGCVRTLKLIGRFAQDNNLNLRPENVNREFLIDLINHISSSDRNPKTIGEYLSNWKGFLDFCQSHNIIPNSNGKLIFNNDYPKRIKSQVKDIPDHVLQQLKNKIFLLPRPITLITEILMETGMRINEVCQLEFNSIEQDSDGDYWINCYRSKVYKENKLFISKELASKIQKQQNFIKDKLQVQFSNLFCSTEGSGWFSEYGKKNKSCKRREINHFIPVARLINQQTVRGYLHQLAHEHNITDISGEIYPIWKCHRFRHTHLTDLARKGTGIAHIMQRAGHASPQMAIQYVHLTNDDQKKKIKEVWDNTHFNMEGEIVAPVNPDLDTAEMQWVKKGMGMQTTDNGYCTLLWTQTCPHQHLPCKSCGSWVTTLDFLDSHKKELEETEKIIENARQKGYQRQIEKNLPRADRLKKIISGMEKHASMRGLGHNEWEEKE